MTDPPGPRSLYGVRNLVAFRRDMLGLFRRLQRRYGDVAAFRIGSYRIVLLSDPAAIEDVLVTRAQQFTKGRALKMSRSVLGDGLLTSEGDVHLRQRRMIQPVFHRPRLEAYAAIMSDCAATWAARWRDGTVVDMALEMRRLALAIVARSLFGDDEPDDEPDELIAALTTLTGMFTRVSNPLGGVLSRLPLPSNRRFHAARRRVDETIHRLIDRHRTDSADRGDLLSRLIQARDTGAGTGDAAPMSDGQIRDETLTLFAAGHETTALALAWTWWLLAEHPAVERRLHGEIDAVVGDAPATFDDLPRLPYTRRVLAESMRLCPPAYAIGRTAESDFETGRSVVPAGTTIIMSPYVVHRDERWYADPERFDPDRWTDETPRQRPRFAYFPFGGGPRICIGESFAWTEGVLVLATLARRFRARMVPGHPVVPQPRITLRPRYGLRMSLHARTGSAAASP